MKTITRCLSPGGRIRSGITAFLLAVLFIWTPKVQATHVAGGEITYRNIGGTNTYEVTLRVYRDCRGVTLGTTSAVNTCIGTVSLGRVAINDITPTCPGQVSPCSPPNTTSGSSALGYEEHVYRGNITIAPSTSANCVMSWTLCCRNNAITTLNGPGGQQMYVQTILNRNLTPKNSSPTFLSQPVAILCVNQPATISPNASDPDGDALQYSLVACRNSSASQNVTYAAGFNATNPLATSTGVTIDPFTGLLNFTPNAIQVGVVCTLVEEFRGGTKIGEIVRDIQINVIGCNNACPVVANIPNQIVPVGNTLCLNVNATDADLDNLTLTATGAVGTFTVTGSGAGFANGQFCFTPTLNQQGQSFTITINAEDDACPNTCTASETFNITVPAVQCSLALSTTSTPASCNTSNGSVSVTQTGGVAPISYTWSNGATTANVGNLAAGQYCVTVVDGFNCVETACVTVVGASGNVVTTATGVQPTCPNSNDGSINVSATGGTAPYSFSLNGGPFLRTNTFTGLGVGTYVISVVDNNGCTGNAITVVLTANDNVAPTISCPSNISVGNDAGQCSAVVSFSVSATDNCPGSVSVTQTSGPASGSSFGIGTSSISFSASDVFGNTSSCSFTVTVSDNENPTVSCPSNVSVSTDAGACSAVVNYSVSSGDNCPGSSLAQTAGQGSGTAFGIGTTTNSFTVVDASGNTASCSFTVTVSDNENPTIACPGNISVNNDPGVCGAAVNYSVSAADNCPGVSTAQTAGQASGSTFGIGTTTNSFTATDASGNTASCSFTVTVTDNEAPVISCPSNISVNNDPGVCGAAVNYSVSSSDNCPGSSQVQTSGLGSGSTFGIGTTTNSFTVTDASGNSASCSFTVTVTDNEAPVINCPSNISVNTDPGVCGAAVSYSVSASDNCPGVTSAQTGGQASGSTFAVGTTSNSFTATDAYGNSSSCSFTVTVTDNEAPAITCPADISLQCRADVVAANANDASATDNCGVAGLAVSESDNGGSGCAGDPWIITRTYTATDIHGNSASCNQTVTVEATPIVTQTNGNHYVFVGYPDSSCATISVSAAGGCPGYTYLWSNGATTASQTVCPTVSTAYTVTVTDVQGCSAVDTVLVCAIDATCTERTNNGVGGSGQSGNGVNQSGNAMIHIAICHIPPGNPANAMTKCLPIPAAQSHMQQVHGGDYLGACGVARPSCDFNNLGSFVNASKAGVPAATALETTIDAFPNPFDRATNIVVNVSEATTASITVFNLNGEQVATLFNGSIEKSKAVEFDGSNLADGIYMVRVITGEGMVMHKKVTLQK